jgi:hypothetical protein
MYAQDYLSMSFFWFLKGKNIPFECSSKNAYSSMLGCAPLDSLRERFYRRTEEVQAQNCLSIPPLVL